MISTSFDSIDNEQRSPHPQTHLTEHPERRVYPMRTTIIEKKLGKSMLAASGLLICCLISFRCGDDDGCTPPAMSNKCDEISNFQCGFMASCEHGILQADWHVHWDCEGEQIITYYDCEYTCPNGCIVEGIVDGWPENGAELVELACLF